MTHSVRYDARYGAAPTAPITMAGTPRVTGISTIVETPSEAETPFDT